jgi:predicted small secreted protein
MRKLIAILGAFALSACGTTNTIGEGIATHGETVVLSASKTLTISFDAYAAAANAVATRVERGGFNEDQLRLIRTLNEQAVKLISNSVAGLTAAERAASLALIVTQLQSFK